MLEVGFGVRKITPAPGNEVPGLFEKRRATGVTDELHVRAAFLRQGEKTAALVQVDAIAIPTPLVQAARAEIYSKAGIDPPAIMIGATHTHSGGPVADLFSSRVNDKYLARLQREIVAAVLSAKRGARTCVTGTAAAAAPGVAFNRRFWMEDGTQSTHPGKLHPGIVRSAGPADDTVTVIGFRDAATFAPAGCIVTFACHATHMNGTEYSADYPRWVVQTLQEAHGPQFGVVFLAAPSADVTQADNLSARPWEFGPYWCERTGRAVGAAAMKGLATMDYQQGAGLDATARTLRARVRKSTKAEVQRAKEMADSAPRDSVDAQVLYARELLEVEDLRHQSPSVPVEVQALRIGEAALWTVPGELFQSFALEVRGTSPFPHTSGVTLANGYCGYICTREAFATGGYEPQLARSSYVEESTGERIVEAASLLLRQLHRRSRREQRKPVWPTLSDTALDGINALEQERRSKHQEAVE